MKSRKKTYGVPGLMEWQANIKCGGATLGIHFSGGNQTAYGVNPAKYTTEDPAIQAIIENSGYYREGRIVLLRDVEGSGAYTIGIAEEEAEDNGEDDAHAEAVADDAQPRSVATAAEVNAVNEVNGGGDADAGALKQVEVACADDAKAYLMEHYGATARQLRYLKSIKDVAKANGIEFVGI